MIVCHVTVIKKEENLKYILGLDGGGSKTKCVISDDQGRVIAMVSSGPSNHQTIGIKAAQQTIHQLFSDALLEANLKREAIEFAFLGLAGADTNCDFKTLNKAMKAIFNDIPFEIVNDTWVIMRSGTKEAYGAVSICGTGANAASINTEGHMNILRALSYPLGGDGGGYEISMKALHYAFRSEELTYKKTRLENEVPKALGKRNIEELLEVMYPNFTLDQKDLNKLPPLVFDLADQGDLVCQEILSHYGQVQAKMLSGVLKKGQLKGQFPIILGGSIFNGIGHTFINAFSSEIKKEYPEVDFIKSQLEPVAGALLFAMDRLKIKTTDDVLENLKKDLRI